MSLKNIWNRKLLNEKLKRKKTMRCFSEVHASQSGIGWIRKLHHVGTSRGSIDQNLDYSNDQNVEYSYDRL